jgi:FkbM family methyltransferase
MIRNVARYVFHLARNAGMRNYRYFRLSVGERGNILFYDRERKRLFRVRSRGFIDSVTANQIYSSNEYNFAFIGRAEQVRGMYQRILDEGRVPLIIDCGANIGLSTQYFAREFPCARIVAIEPDARNVAVARENCAGFDNIAICHAAIGSTPGHVAIDNSGADANAFRVSRVDDGAGIRVVTIPEVLADHPDADPLIVKIDIEGFERDLFAHNTGWLEQCDVVVVELHDWMLPGQASSQNFIRTVGEYDRDFLFQGESVFSIRNRA